MYKLIKNIFIAISLSSLVLATTPANASYSSTQKHAHNSPVLHVGQKGHFTTMLSGPDECQRIAEDRKVECQDEVNDKSATAAFLCLGLTNPKLIVACEISVTWAYNKGMNACQKQYNDSLKACRESGV